MKLSDWLRENGIKRKDFAALIGVGAPYMTELCAGGKWPGHDVAKRIEEETKGAVTPSDFYR